MLQGGYAEGGSSPLDFREWQKQNKVFDGMAAYWMVDMNLSAPGQEPERVQGARITSNLFPLLGVTPSLGRDFAADEEQYGHDRKAIISYAMWQERFGHDSSVLGHVINLSGTPYTVVGVTPKGLPFFDNIPPVDIWVPLSFAPGDDMNTRSNHFLPVVARLKPGVSLQQAQADMTNISRRLVEQYPENAGLGCKVVSMRDQVVGNFRLALLVLGGAVGFVLLIACANVTNLLLARAATREREFAVRAALGAGRARIVRQLLIESLSLGLLGGLAGVMLAAWGITSLSALVPSRLPRFNPISMNGSVLLFTAVIFGLVPAFQASNCDLQQALKEGSRGSAGGRGPNRLRNVLVVGELAMALTLLICSGLMLRSFDRLRHIDPGFAAQNLLTMQIPMAETRYPKPEQARAFLEQLLDRVRTLPGVKSAGIATALPLGVGGGWGKNITMMGQPAPPSLDKVPLVNFELDSLDYLRTITARLREGRLFTPQDNENGQPVAIINEALARRFFLDQNPVGKSIRMMPPLSLIPPQHRDSKQLPPVRTIVGVIADVKNGSLNRTVRPTVYAPYYQDQNEGWFTTVWLAVRTSSNPLALAPAVRGQVEGLDSDQPVARVATMENLIGQSHSQTRFNTLLLGLFAALALVLATVGTYGVVSYSTTQRVHEIGIRIALGAERGHVLKMVVGQGLLLASAGVSLGLVAAAALTRLMVSMLVGVRPADLATYTAATLLLAAVTLVASYIPARRATKVDPMVALRYE